MKPKVIAIERKIIELPNEEMQQFAEDFMDKAVQARDNLISLQNEFADSVKKFR